MTPDTFDHRPTLISLAWDGGSLQPTGPLLEPTEGHAAITLLHTNDFHATIDGEEDADGKLIGSLARIATTIRRAQASGPTLVLDVGDVVHGPGSWWDVDGAAIVAQLRGEAGCDLATFGNHDLERGMAGVWELLEGGFPFVSANVQFADSELQKLIMPAYIAHLGGLRVGLTGITTLMTRDHTPPRLLQDMTLQEPLTAVTPIIEALDQWVDVTVILAHLGFYRDGVGDPALARQVAGSRVKVILSAHTHSVLKPPVEISGITICNAGAHGSGVGIVNITRSAPEHFTVQTHIVVQDDTVLADEAYIRRQAVLARPLESLKHLLLPLPLIEEVNLATFERRREALLLARALQAAGYIESGLLLLVPFFTLPGRLPRHEVITLAELSTVYPTAEQWVRAVSTGEQLVHLIDQQDNARYIDQRCELLWLTEERPATRDDLATRAVVNVITTECLASGGLGWGFIAQNQEMLHVTALALVKHYLAGMQS